METWQDTQTSTQTAVLPKRRRGQRLKKAARARLKVRGLQMAGDYLVTDICQELGIHRRTWYTWLSDDVKFRKAVKRKMNSYRLLPYEPSFQAWADDVKGMTERELLRVGGRLLR